MTSEANFNLRKTSRKDPQQKRAFNLKEKWWTPVWRGLPVEPTGKHYHLMRNALWLYLYLLVYANRRTGTLFRRNSTISRDMGVNSRTISRWMNTLRKGGYIETRRRAGRALDISITKWKPIKKS